MRFKLGNGLMDCVERRAGEFELTAGLERDPCPDRCVVETNDIRSVVDRRPAGPLLHSLEKCADAALAPRGRVFIGHGRTAGPVKWNFLMLGADPELLRRPRAACDPGDQFIARRDGGGIRDVASHCQILLSLAPIFAVPKTRDQPAAPPRAAT